MIARFAKDGDFEPIAVCWKDGRTFFIDEILEIGAFGPPKHGKREMRYRVRFGDHETELYLERRDGRPMTGELETLRWWVLAFDRKASASQAAGAGEPEGLRCTTGIPCASSLMSTAATEMATSARPERAASSAASDGSISAHSNPLPLRAGFNLDPLHALASTS